MDTVREKICNAVLNNKQLSYDILISLGLSIQDISKLVGEGCLIVDDELTFKVAVDYLYQYGVELSEFNDFNRANKCFRKCFAIDSNHYFSILQLLLSCINSKYFDEAYEWLDKLYVIGGQVAEVANLYLFLLNSFTICPKKYDLKLKQLGKENMRISIFDSMDNKSIIDSILAGERNRLVEDTDFMNTIEGRVLKQIMFYSSFLPKGYMISLGKLVRERKYDELCEVLTRRKLTVNNELFDYCLKILHDIKNIIQTGNIPECCLGECASTFDAIDKKDYYSALRFNSSYCRKKGHMLDGLLSYLLFDINELIGYIKLGKEININDGPDRITLPYIERTLREGDYGRYLSILGRYLKHIGESDKFDLICFFTMLSILKGNREYKHPINCLANIFSGEYSFSYESSLDKIRAHVDAHNFMEAEIGLRILRTGGNSVVCDELESVLAKAREAIDYPRDGQARYSDISDEERKGILDRYNYFCSLYNIRCSLYNDIRQFMKNDEMNAIFKYDLFDGDINRLKSDMWFAFGDKSLDIKIFNDDKHIVVYLRRVKPKSDVVPWEEFSSVKNLVAYLSEQLSSCNYQECIAMITNLLKYGSFGVRIENTSIDIFLILIKSYLGVAKSGCDEEKAHLCEVAASYLELVSAINATGRLNYSREIDNAYKLLEACRNENKKDDKVELAESHAWSAYYSGMSLEEYVNAIKGDVSYDVILLMRLIYAEKVCVDIKERERIFCEVENDSNVTSEVLVYLEVARGRLANVPIVRYLEET